MIYTVGHIVGRIVGRSKALDPNGRRYYRLVSLRTGLVYEVSGDLLREAQCLQFHGFPIAAPGAYAPLSRDDRESFLLGV
jgi:hypothetical protein